jgi:hypothetical protein
MPITIGLTLVGSKNANEKPDTGVIRNARKPTSGLTAIWVTVVGDDLWSSGVAALALKYN